MTLIIDDQHEIVGRWVCSRTGGTFSGGTALGLQKSGELVAGVLYDNYNGASVCMHVAGEGRWMNRDFLWYAFHYPFNEMKVKKIIGLVPSVAENVLQFDEHIGFVEEHRIADAHPEGDLVILSMTREQCRFLEFKVNGRQVRSTTSS